MWLCVFLCAQGQLGSSSEKNQTVVDAVALQLGLDKAFVSQALGQSTSVAGMAAMLSGGTHGLSEAAALVQSDLKAASIHLDAAVIKKGFYPSCPDPWAHPRVVLLTGATGFLGTYVCMACVWACVQLVSCGCICLLAATRFQPTRATYRTTFWLQVPVGRAPHTNTGAHRVSRAAQDHRSWRDTHAHLPPPLCSPHGWVAMG